MSNVRDEMDQVILALEKEGIYKDDYLRSNVDKVGLGDVIESTLKKFGITEERFKEWFNLKECNCSKRKIWLNSIFSWKRHKK